MGSGCALLMQLTSRTLLNSSNRLYLNKIIDLIRLKSTRHIRYTHQAMRNTTISSMTLQLRIIMATTLSLRWGHILARVHLSLPPPTATQLRHHRHLSFLEWVVRMALGPFFHLIALFRLLALRIRTLSDTSVADTPILAHTMERWTFRRWIPMSSVSSSRCKCRSTRLTMVAWFLTRPSRLPQHHTQDLSTIPGRSYRRVMYMVEDAEAYQTQQRACIRARVISLFRSHYLVVRVADYVVMSVLRTCATGRRF